jgi:hypothetical protein
MVIYSHEYKPIYASILSEKYSYFKNELEQLSVAAQSSVPEEATGKATGELSSDAEGARADEHVTEYSKDQTEVYSQLHTS